MFIEYRSLGWWYWMVLAVLLTAGVAGWTPGFTLALSLAAVQLIHFAILKRSLTAFPVQVRLVYLLVLLACFALPAQLRWIFMMPTVGTWITALFGYCIVARVVCLLPWNRSEAFSADLLKRAFFSAPTRGSILFPSA